MIYESTIQYTAVDKNGNDKTAKEHYVHADEELFGAVEQDLYERFQDRKDIDVASIKRSRIREVANGRTDEQQRIWVAELLGVTTNDEGEEVELTYKVLLHATDFGDAHRFIESYIRQGYDLTLVSLKLTQFKEVF